MERQQPIGRLKKGFSGSGVCSACGWQGSLCGQRTRACGTGAICTLSCAFPMCLLSFFLLVVEKKTPGGPNPFLKLCYPFNYLLLFEKKTKKKWYQWQPLIGQHPLPPPPPFIDRISKEQKNFSFVCFHYCFVCQTFKGF